MKSSLLSICFSSCLLTSTIALDFDWKPLWPEGAPNARSSEPKDTPAISVHLASGLSTNTGAAAIVFPGGGFSKLSLDHEGLQVCGWLNKMGVNAFLVRYRLIPDNYDPQVAFLDAKRAVRYVRSRAVELKIDPNRIGVVGFSAGGHLAFSLGREFDAGDQAAPDPVERVSCKPNFAVLAYAAAIDWERLRVRFTNKPIGPETPPMFIFHTDADASIPAEDAIDLYLKLRWAGVQSELHIFGGYGPHGAGLATGDPAVGQWPDLAERWLRKSGFLTQKRRVPISGSIAVAGRPFAGGWFILTPVDSAGDPIVSRFLWFREQAKFAIPAEHGPVPGRYRVTAHEVALTTDSRNPTLPNVCTYSRSRTNEAPFEVEISEGQRELAIDFRE